MRVTPSHLIRLLVAACFAFLLQGCAAPTGIPVLPDKLDGKGLLVARFYVLGMHAMENASISIDGKLVGSQVRDGYVAIPLEPGEHRLDQLRAQGQLLSRSQVADESPMRLAAMQKAAYIYIPGGTYTVHYTTLSVDRGFNIEAGKITNLGLIVYVPTQDPGKKAASPGNARQFNVIALDNSADTSTFMETNYPTLMAGMSDRTINLATGKYLEADKLPNLRKLIAYHESRGPNVLEVGDRMYVYARAGTVVTVGKSSSDGKADIDALDTGTLSDVVGAVRRGDQVTFMTSNGRLLAVEGKSLRASELPVRAHPIDFQALGQRAFVAVDNRMRILIQKDGGEPWLSHDGAMIKDIRNDIRILPDDTGAYITLGYKGYSTAIYYLPESQTVPQQLPTPLTPANMRGGPSVVESHFHVARKSGLFVLFDKQEFFFWSKSKGAWFTHSRPAEKCKPIRFDADGVKLKVECGGIQYDSVDSGATWKAQQT